MDKEMQKALEADGEKLRQLTGEDHGPYFDSAPSYSELVRALAFAIEELDNAKYSEGYTPATIAGEAQLESARKLLLRAQGSPEPKRAKALPCERGEHIWTIDAASRGLIDICRICGEERGRNAK